MAPDIQESPFVKQLASSDRPTREKALESLRIYLSSQRQLTNIELLKLWRGLFFCLWHTPSPLPSQSLCNSLSSLLLSLPANQFIPFLRAFWNTIISNYTSIPSLRLDKYLLLIRYYVRSSFQYLKSQRWDSELVEEWTAVMEGEEEEDGLGPLSPGNRKVPDGVRYHVLDLWVDELEGVVGAEEDGMLKEGLDEMLMEPVKRLEREGGSKIVRSRAREVLEDERVREIAPDEERKEMENGRRDDDEEWGGFEK
ncbi:MAG: hypothetical protein L6R39_003485 [Caloplaca ligustica]|nr:MAG: hypothetical protein L6R39_003485 [Caloplaca ligustica]